MNYILGILIILIVSLFFISKHLYDKNSILVENEKLIVSGYETSIKNIEDKAKFDLDIEKSKAPTIKASEKVKIETKKRGEKDDKESTDNTSGHFNRQPPAPKSARPRYQSGEPFDRRRRDHPSPRLPRRARPIRPPFFFTQRRRV